MPTGKRERQRANREVRRAEERRVHQKQRWIRLGRRVLIIAALVAVALFVLSLISGGGDDETTTTTAATTTTGGETTSTTGGTTTTTTPPADAAANYAEFREQSTACGATAPEPVTEMTFDAPTDQDLPAEGTVTATFETSCGDIVVDLAVAEAPRTVESLVFLARAGYFDGQAFHRVVPGFVVQGGDPGATGSGGPGYTVPDEFPEPGFAYDRGVVAMANAGAGTTGSQFFFTLDATQLPNAYSLVGEVVEGFETLDRIAALPVAGLPTDLEASRPLETVYIERVVIEAG